MNPHSYRLKGRDFVHQGKIEIDVNERAVFIRTQGCFFVYTNSDCFLNSLWSNADYDAIIDECTTGDLCTDAEGRWERLYDAEQIVMDEAVIFPLYTQCNAEMLSSKVTGVEYHPVALNRVYKDAVKTE